MVQSDPWRDSRGAKSGAADAGSLTPRLPSDTDPTPAAGSSRGTDRRADCIA